MGFELVETVSLRQVLEGTEGSGGEGTGERFVRWQVGGDSGSSWSARAIR